MTLIKGKALIRGNIEPVTIIVNEDGIIDDVVLGLEDRPGYGEKYDYTRIGCLILPGMVDLHVHMRDLELSYKEDYFTGTASAAAGGVVLIADMPNTIPKTSTLEALKMKMEAARAKAIVDYTFYYGIPDDPKSVCEDIATYIVGFKVYPEDFKHKEVLKKIFSLAIKYNLLVMFHAEDPELYNVNGVYGEERPVASEVSGVKRVIEMVSEANPKTHITHVSSYEAAKVIINSKKTLNLTFDVTPHHMLLNNSIYKRYNGLAKVYPPLRTEFDNKMLQDLVAKGYVDAITTDHAPHSLEEKTKGYRDALPGFPGLEYCLPLLLTLSSHGIVSLQRVVECYSKIPAKILGVNGLFGEIKVGAYGSLVVVDLKREFKIDPSKSFSKAKYTPFEGWRVKGKPIATFIRGTLVFEEDTLHVSRGFGKHVRVKS